MTEEKQVTESQQESTGVQQIIPVENVDTAPIASEPTTAAVDAAGSIVPEDKKETITEQEPIAKEDPIEDNVDLARITTVAGNLSGYFDLVGKSDTFKKEDVNVEGTNTNLYSKLIDNPLVVPAAIFNNEHILADDDNEGLKEQVLAKSTDWKCGSEVSGKMARLAFTARGRGLFQLRSYSTGISTTMRVPTNGELNAILETVDIKGEQLGRMLGDLQYMPYSTFFKEAILNLLDLIVVDSTLVGWDSDVPLRDVLSIQDYEDFVWAIGSMLVDRKLTMRRVCAECGHEQSSEYDYGRFQLMRSIPRNCVDKLHSGKKMTLDDLTEYKEVLYKDFKPVIENWGIRFNLRVPTITEVISNSKSILAELESMLSTSVLVYREKNVFDKLLMQLNLNFTPWIESMDMLNEKGEVVTTCSDRSEFGAILNDFAQDEEYESFYNNLIKFIAKTKTTVIGYRATKCDNKECGSEQTRYEEGGYTAFDPEQAFFMIAYRKLELEKALAATKL